jgi:hypothetical protein
VEGSTSYRDEGISFTVHGIYHRDNSRWFPRTNGIETNTVAVWNGRLDNAPDLARELGRLNANCQELDLVTSAYARWGTEASQNKGDWALVVTGCTRPRVSLWRKIRLALGNHSSMRTRLKA